RPMRSCWGRRRRGWGWRTWPGWPARCTSGPGRTRPIPAVLTARTATAIRGALTPECAEFVQTVLDALSAPSGADDDRSHEQRYHDALQEAMERLVAAGLVPERGGAAAHVRAYISLA